MGANAIAFSRALGLTKADMLGFSIGGMVAQEITLQAPDLVRKLILVGTGPRGGEGMESMTQVAKRIFGAVYDPPEHLWLAVLFSRSEAAQVLRPSGRAVFVATDWGALVWRSESPSRMALVMKAWESHCAHPHLPRSLTSRLTGAGFRFAGAAVFPILNLQWHDDTYSKGLAGLITTLWAARAIFRLMS